MAPKRVPALPWRDALPFLQHHGLARHAEAIQNSPPFRSFGTQVKKAKAVALMKRRGIFEEFCNTYWPIGLTPAGQPLLGRYKKLYDNVKTSSILTGIAGVHYVVSELSRRGSIALPTIRNTGAYDIIATSRDGKRHANIQVKATAVRSTFWLLPPSDAIRFGPDDYYVFVRWFEKGERWEAFLVKGREVKQVAKKREAEIRKKRHTKEMRAFHIGDGAGRKARRWASAWRDWRIE